MIDRRGVGVDLDGVLADYRSLIGADDIETPASVYARLEETPNLWETLPPYPGTTDALRRLSGAPGPVYFLTRRPGPDAQRQTARWLEQWGYDGSPSVCVVAQDLAKGQLAHLLGLRAVIDDSMRVGRGVRRCRFYLVDRPWNREERTLRTQRRVHSVRDALDAEGWP